jgi:hypothetical protein
MSESFSSRGQALMSLLRHTAGTQRPPAKMLYNLADLLAAEGRFDDFADAFRRAFQQLPMQRPMLDEEPGVSQTVRARKLRVQARALLDRGIRYAPVLAALALSEAILGNIDAVKRLVDYERFFRCGPVAPRAGFGDAPYNAALASEIRSNLVFHGEPSRRPLRGGWRHDRLLESKMPACRALEREIRAEVSRYIAGLPDDPDHPFIASWPQRFSLDSWAVVAGSDTHIEPHIHFRAWLSGVYYVSSGQTRRGEPGSHGGWLHVGPPAPVRTSDGWEERLVEPEPGNIVLMPGYFFHATTPTGSEQDRICVAFNVTPMELAEAGSLQDSY